MKIKTFSVILLILAIMLPFSARADTVSVTLTGVSGDISQGIYISPYFATVGGLANTQIWCVDFTHWDWIGQQWTAYVTPVNGPDYSNTYLKIGDTYKEMAWLITQYSSQDLANRTAMQWVIWDLSIGTKAHEFLYSNGLYDYWYNLDVTQKGYKNGDYTGWAILSGTAGNNSCSSQEFMTKVPEPSIILLLGSGLVGLWGFRRKFKK